MSIYFHFYLQLYRCILLIEYNVEIVDNQVILIARQQDLEKSERSRIPDEMEVESKPVVAIIGAGAGKYC